MRGLGLIMLACACAPNGLTVEVVISDPNIKKVELFAGERCETDCPRATVAPGLPPLAVTNAFLVVDPLPFTVVENDFTDGVAGFRIETSQDVTLPILAIVAYDAQNEIRWSWSKHWVDIPDGDSERWRINLDATTVIAPMADTQPPGTERHKLWPAAGGLPSCLLLEHWESTTVERDLLGPATDPDCDNVPPANECAPWIPNAMAALPPVEETTCVINSNAYGPQTCLLGGPQCSEQPLGAHDECVVVNEPYCAPDSLCQCSGMPDLRMCLGERISTGTGNTAVIPHVKCVVPIDASGNACTSGTFALDMSNAFVGGVSQRKCASLRLNDLDTPLGTFESFVHIGMGKLKIENLVEPCRADVRWEGGGALPPPTGFAILDLELDTRFHLVYPLRVELKQGCTMSTSGLCQLVMPATDSMYQCAQAPMPQPGACAPSATPSFCPEGPYCNGVCCGYGERCTANGCRCGTAPACTGTDRCEQMVSNPDQCGVLCCGPDNLCPF